MRCDDENRASHLNRPEVQKTEPDGVFLVEIWPDIGVLGLLNVAITMGSDRNAIPITRSKPNPVDHPHWAFLVA